MRKKYSTNIFAFSEEENIEMSQAGMEEDDDDESGEFGEEDRASQTDSMGE